MKATFEGMQIETGCEMLDVTSRHRPDTSWRYTDKAGHEHRWFVDGKPADSYRPEAKHETPTLKWVKDGEAYWPDADEPHDVGHHECKECGEHIEPRFTADDHRQMIAGLRWFKVNGRDVSMEEFEEIKRQFESTHRSGH